MDKILTVNNLETSFITSKGTAMAVDGLSFEVFKGKTHAIVGESGGGKSVSALSLLRLIQEPIGSIKAKEILFHGKNLATLSNRAMRDIRGNKISIIFQEPMTSLNPVLTIGSQVIEVLRLHKGMTKITGRKKAIELLSVVHIPDPERVMGEFPHQLSGGMKQRIMIAMAIACEPDLLIADEPTTALDVTIQAQILNLLGELQNKNNMAIILITHDMGVVYETADYITVMYAGRAVEQADRASFFKRVKHPYTVKLLESLPDKNKRGKELSVIPGMVPLPTKYPSGCRFEERCPKRFDRCKTEDPVLREIGKGHFIACHLENYEGLNPCIKVKYEKGKEINTYNNEDFLSINELKIYYPIRKGIFQRTVGYVKAVDNISFHLKKGETLALVGESGCGKTTTGKGIIRLIDITGGTVTYNGSDLSKVSSSRLKTLRKDLQIMFQDPYGSLNPRMMVSQIISEGMNAHNIGKSRKEQIFFIKELMERVGLDPGMIYRYPHEFSGGQRQRIGIARFLSVRPKFVVCDEVTSALDISVQAQILNLLKRLQNEEGMSYLFITHNLQVVSYISDRVSVMYLGRIVEEGLVPEVFDNTKHPYTKALLAASPQVGSRLKEKIVLEGEPPSPINPPTGCHFHPRCPYVLPRCSKEYPENSYITKTHKTKCWLY